MKERIYMDILRELYTACSESQEAEDALKESDHGLFDYMRHHITEAEKMVFFDTINSILRVREEYFFTFGFQMAVKLLLGQR